MQNIFELAYGELLRKQRSINRLFPSFDDRVKKLKDVGGIRLHSTTPGTWQFKVASNSRPGHRYDTYLHWKNIEPVLKNKVKDMRLWKKDKSGVDLRKLAIEVMFATDLEVNCSCPADLYWGGQYIRTQKRAKYTNPENRPPETRNPKQYGAMCKHLQLVFDLLPFYASTMSSYLSKTYGDNIEDAEEDARKRAGIYKKAAKFLKKKEEEEEEEKEEDIKKEEKPEEPEEEEEKEEEEEETSERKVVELCNHFM